MSGLRTALPQALREIRIHMCQSSSESAATRSFVSKVFPEVKKHNPTLPILIREAAEVPPRAIARGERGLERSADLRGAADHNEVESRIAQLVHEIAR